MDNLSLIYNTLYLINAVGYPLSFAFAGLLAVFFVSFSFELCKESNNIRGSKYCKLWEQLVDTMVIKHTPNESY